MVMWVCVWSESRVSEEQRAGLGGMFAFQEISLPSARRFPWIERRGSVKNPASS